MSGKSDKDFEIDSKVSKDRSICEKSRMTYVGGGGNADVYRGYPIDESTESAVKIAKEGSRYFFQLENEKRILKYLTDSGYKYSPYFYGGKEGELIMEYVAGDTLEKLIKEGISEKRLKDIFIEMCEMIYALHGLNPPVIHRDIKPSNMIVDDRGKLKLIDFGTAVILNGYEGKVHDECGDVLLAGTKGYAAPEQYGGLTEGIKTDIYQIGKTMRRIIDRADVSRDFFEGVMEIADRCCSSSFYERYSGVSDIRIDLIKIKTSSLKKALFGRMFLHGKRCIKESDKSKDNRLFIDIVRTCDSIEFL